MSINKWIFLLKLSFINSFSSDTCDKDFELVENEIDRIRQMIEQRYLDFVQLIDSEKNILLIKIEDYIGSITSK